MDLLSSYDDEASNISDQQVNKSGSTGMFQSEWENFEKSIGSSSSPPNATSPTNRDSKSSEESVPSPAKGDKLNESITNQEPVSEKMEEDEEDESHLPPGVRKKNRCHNSSSSSSSSEDEGKQKAGSHSDTDHSDSDSDLAQEKNSTKDIKMEETKERRPSKSKEASKRSSRKSRSSKSVSRSRSRSPHRKRRKSSDYKKRSRSRSRGRHHKERKHSSRRSRSRERKRSKDRDHRSRHRDQRHSRSRSRDRRKRRERRSSHERSRRSRSRSKSRDRKKRSPSPPRGAKVIKYGDKVIKAGASFGRPPPSKPMTFKEKMRQQFIKAMEEGGDVSQALTSKDGTVICTQTAGTQQVPPPKKAPVPLMANLVTSTAGLAAATITASEAAMQSMIQMQKEATEKTGVEIPKYYNPAAINPMKYAEQVQKRKLLWSKTKDKEINSQWHATTLSSDHDSKSKEKFRKLMGIKQEGGSETDDDKKVSEEEMKQREMFDKLDKEYQYARMATHTHRGIGLGFGSTSYQPPAS